MAASWPRPQALEGVKSKQRPIFEVADVDFAGTRGAESREVSGIRLCLSSRIAAIGDVGMAAVALLTGETELCSGNLTRHDSLRVLRLEPRALAAGRSAGGSYVEAINIAVLQERPQVIVLDEALAQKDLEWAAAFQATLVSEPLRTFQGAVIIAVADETHGLAGLCSECWFASRGCLPQQQPYMEVIENALEAGAGAEDLIAEALSIGYCHLGHWFDIARSEGQKITLFATMGPNGKRHLCGFLCHHMIESRAEFHIRFVFVPEESRGSGLGARVLRWAIGKANRMQQSDCRWISLKTAFESLIPWYEKFGFMDMTCGQHLEEDEVWMELKNDSIHISE